MVVDAVRTYLDAASGLTELSRKEAVAAAKVLLRAGGAGVPTAEAEPGGAPLRVGQSIQALAGELLETSRANREALAELVRSEVEHRLERMDVVPRSEHERLVRRVAELERRLAARADRERVPAVPAVEVRSVEEAAAAGEATAVAPGPVEEADRGKTGVRGQGASPATGAPDASGTPVGRDGVPADGSAEGTAEAEQGAPRGKPAAKGGRARAGAGKRTAKSRGATKK